MKKAELLEELKKLNEELLCEKEETRQATMELDQSASCSKRELQRLKTSISKKLSNGSEAEADDSQKISLQ
tara:strand:+ start:636 stop:848 length:213 start_codon:yes stop_codon:yes gene_type:complete